VKFLFAMFQGGGNIPLIAPIAGELAARGHEVRVLAGPGIRRNRVPLGQAFLQRMRAAGCEVVPLGAPETHPFDADDAPKRATNRWVPQAFTREAREAHTTLWSTCWAENVRDEIARDPPDAVVADFMLLGALLAAEAAGVPSVAVVHNLPPPHSGGTMPPQSQGFLPARDEAEEVRYRKWREVIRRVWIREGLEPHNRARAMFGLGPISEPREQLSSCNRVLVLASRHFDFAGDLPSNTMYVGTPVDDLESGGLWSSPWPSEDERPLVLISFSTLAQGQAPVLRRCIDAAGSLPVRVLVTLGPSMTRADFPAPENTVFETFVPHSAVLPYVSAIVSQCGLGTLTKALKHGVPVVCVPLAGDQPDNAARVEAHGAGIRLSATATTEELHAGIQRVLEDGVYRQGAVALARLIVEDGAAEAADQIGEVSSAPRGR
jgi:MGT family glycosyltransferase